MYEVVNIDVLSDMLDINLACPSEKFSMLYFMGDNLFGCGTTHCLVGNYVVKRNQKVNGQYVWSIHNQLGITSREFEFLFLGNILNSSQSRDATSLTQKEALTRLAKFIIYKRRKKEVWMDYEKARRTEGDNMFCDVVNELESILV